MKFDLKPFKIGDLVGAYRSGSLTRNPEYQRGAAWSPHQKQALIDSVFREYPLPAFFLEVKERSGLSGEVTKTYEIIDGQQRILALDEYLRDDFELLKASNPKLRLPLSMRAAPAPWEGKRFSDLSSELQDKIRASIVQSYLVQEVTNSDEVRDLFIRLQSGTALTRQQIRDAWPGELGPRIERWAGKLTKHPKFSFFDAVDGRGTRDDEDDSNDPYVKHRTTCAQLTLILLSRVSNPFAHPSIKAADLDGMYHRYTQLPADGNPLDDVEKVLALVQEVIAQIANKTSGKRKVPKIALFALAMFLQDVLRADNIRLTTEQKRKLASHVSDPPITQNSRASSGGVITSYYERWREALPEGIGAPLDSKRLFDDADKVIIRQRCEGRCGVCGEEVIGGDDEYDHFPTPYRDGGRTVPENGRLVHANCHPRGRPKAGDS